jgi:hypothetical protein
LDEEKSKHAGSAQQKMVLAQHFGSIAYTVLLCDSYKKLKGTAKGLTRAREECNNYVPDSLFLIGQS